VERGEPVLLGHCGRADVLDQLGRRERWLPRVEVDVEAPKVAGSSGGFTLETGSESEVVYKGDRPLAFGVELCELSYQSNRRSFRLKAPEDLVRGRGPSAEAPRGSG
jgi:hypothetical protein